MVCRMGVSKNDNKYNDTLHSGSLAGVAPSPFGSCSAPHLVSSILLMSSGDRNTPPRVIQHLA